MLARRAANRGQLTAGLGLDGNSQVRAWQIEQVRIPQNLRADGGLVRNHPARSIPIGMAR
ncbi:hypothetical protein CEQ30_03405 [Nocardia brasiliensis]|nr:hypothetical protein CEQ30_03405 [Nocardia brasiliensis]